MFANNMLFRIYFRSALAVLAVLATGVVALKPAYAEQFIQIGAHVDGRDRLIIQGDTLQWHHFDYAAVGRHEGANSPTMIDTQDFHAQWVPEWPEPVPSEIRFRAFTSVFYGLTPPLPSEAIKWHLTRHPGRGEVHILAQPSATNQFKLIVEFNDNVPLGSTFYAIKLSPAKQVVMDIQPFTRSNTVNPNSSKVLKVAVMSNLLPSGFDATEIIPASVKFGPSGAGLVSSKLTDVNEDGHLDAIFSFRTNETGIACGDTEAVLTGNTVSGYEIEGRDVLRTVGCR